MPCFPSVLRLLVRSCGSRACRQRRAWAPGPPATEREGSCLTRSVIEATATWLFQTPCASRKASEVGEVFPRPRGANGGSQGCEAVQSHEASEEQSSRPASVCLQSPCLTPAAGRKRPGPAVGQNDQDGDQRVAGKDRGVLDEGRAGSTAGVGPGSSLRPPRWPGPGSLSLFVNSGVSLGEARSLFQP